MGSAVVCHRDAVELFADQSTLDREAVYKRFRRFENGKWLSAVLLSDTDAVIEPSENDVMTAGNIKHDIASVLYELNELFSRQSNSPPDAGCRRFPPNRPR